jgi:hypothetical protein
MLNNPKLETDFPCSGFLISGIYIPQNYPVIMWERVNDHPLITMSQPIPLLSRPIIILLHMTSPFESITIHCPECGLNFSDYIERSSDEDTDTYDDEEDDCEFVTCPQCGASIAKEGSSADKDEDSSFD